MSDDTIVYDYGVIEECLSMMSKKAGEIEQQTDELEADVKRIMVDWKGDTADAYNQLCQDLHNDLQQNRDNLDNLNKAFSDGSDAMKHQDSSGAGTVGNS